MSILTDKERIELQEYHRKVQAINHKMRSKSIYEGDAMIGRNNDGFWTEVIYSGTDPDSEKPFFQELPDGKRCYFDRLADYQDSDDLGTQNQIEGELTEADIHSWY